MILILNKSGNMFPVTKTKFCDNYRTLFLCYDFQIIPPNLLLVIIPRNQKTNRWSQRKKMLEIKTKFDPKN